MKNCETSRLPYPANPSDPSDPSGTPSFENNRSTARFGFRAGELYLFHPSDPACPDTSSLWGVFGTRDPRGVLRLESASTDLFRFRFGVELAARNYPFCRLASRDELRDYCYNLAVYESTLRQAVSVSVQVEA